MKDSEKLADITYPPELLPCAGDDDAEVIVCCGGDKCRDGLICESRQIIVATGQQQAPLH